jgi:hypothetical protein
MNKTVGNKMSKKLLVAIVHILTLVMMVSIFAGCSSDKQDDKSDRESRDEDVTSDATSSDDYEDEMISEDVVADYDSEDVAPDYNYEESDSDGISYEDSVEEEYYQEDVDISGETYEDIVENEFIPTSAENTSTFSIDVDTASYANIRNMINFGEIPPADAVRIEEMINYFSYEYTSPSEEDVFSINTTIAECPWDEHSELLMIGMQGYNLPDYQLPDNNIVLLLDVSGSMNEPNKLPLLVDAFKILVENFDEDDTVSIVVYAGASGVILNGVSGNHQDVITEALDKLSAGGSTAGSDGIELAYELAEQNFIEDGNNRVILATDGDFNVGITGQSNLENFIAEKRETGVFLSVLGFGRGNYDDSTAEILADKGNGNCSYIDSVSEAEKVFGQEFAGTLFAIAKDVKLQVEFNESIVYAYKLVGYENRVMANEDFEDDSKDAGELGLGHTVTALYEVKLLEGVEIDGDELICTVDVRYKLPDEDESNIINLGPSTLHIVNNVQQKKESKQIQICIWKKSKSKDFFFFKIKLFLNINFFHFKILVSKPLQKI